MVDVPVGHDHIVELTDRLRLQVRDYRVRTARISRVNQHRNAVRAQENGVRLADVKDVHFAPRSSRGDGHRRRGFASVLFAAVACRKQRKATKHRAKN